MIRRKDPVVERSLGTSRSTHVELHAQVTAALALSDRRKAWLLSFPDCEFSNSGAADPYSNSFGRNCSNSSCTRRSAPSPENSVARNSPVDKSSAANPTRSPTCASAARKLFSSDPSDESAAVPGVTTRVTSRRTSFFASRGSSICSQIATLNPLRISFPMYPSAA